MSACMKSGSALALLLLLSACQDRAGDGDTANTAARGETVADATAPGGTMPAEGTSAGGPGSAGDRPLLSIAGDGTGPGYLTDGAGQSLYVLEGNTAGERCDAACEEVWPPALTDSQTMPRIDPRIGPGGAGVIPRDDGSQHVTYGGEPLYRYAADAGAGRTPGDGVQDQWGQWKLVRVDGAPEGTGTGNN